MTARSRSVSIVDALGDPRLFGSLPAFENLSTWSRWLTFLKAVYGLPLDPEELAVFREHTGRETPRENGYPEAAVIVGVQSGKSQICALIAAYEAARAVLARKRNLYVPLIAQDFKAATRALFSYVAEAIEASPALAAQVVRQTTSEVELSRGVTLATFPCRPAAIRGLRAAAVVIDELAFFIQTDGRPTDTEMLRAARGRVATTNGKVIVLSSPYAQSGALYELHRRHHGQEDSPVLVWQATAPQMNPTLSADYLARMVTEDPEAAEAELFGRFRAGVSTFVDPQALAEVVETGVRERQPDPGTTYRGYVDAASGSGKDSFAVAVAHKDGERAVLDAVYAWSPPFNPSGVITEASELLRRFDISSVQGDRYAPGFVSEGFRKHSITYNAAPRTTSDTYLELLPLVNAGAVVLLDDPKLLRELRGLERRRGTAGKDKVDHRPGAHDDRATAAAGALVSAIPPSKKRPVKVRLVAGRRAHVNRPRSRRPPSGRYIRTTPGGVAIYHDRGT